jgi:hypothetical protein
MENKSGSGMRDEHPRSFFQELRSRFFGLKKMLQKFFDADPGYGIFFDSGSWMGKFGSGSATLCSTRKICDFWA